MARHSVNGALTVRHESARFDFKGLATPAYVHLQAFSPSRVVLRHVAGTLGNLTSVLESTPTGGRLHNNDGYGPTIYTVLRKLSEVDDLVSQLYGFDHPWNI